MEKAILMMKINFISHHKRYDFNVQSYYLCNNNLCQEVDSELEWYKWKCSRDSFSLEKCLSFNDVFKWKSSHSSWMMINLNIIIHFFTMWSSFNVIFVQCDFSQCDFPQCDESYWFLLTDLINLTSHHHIT